MVNVKQAKVESYTKAKSNFWLGFVNMGLSSSSLLAGLSPTASTNGQGEYVYSTMSTTSGTIKQLNKVPYREVVRLESLDTRSPAHFFWDRRMMLTSYQEMECTGYRLPTISETTPRSGATHGMLQQLASSP